MSNEDKQAIRTTLLIFSYFLGFGSLINTGLIFLAGDCSINACTFYIESNGWISLMMLGAAGISVGIRTLFK